MSDDRLINEKTVRERMQEEDLVEYLDGFSVDHSDIKKGTRKSRGRLVKRVLEWQGRIMKGLWAGVAGLVLWHSWYII